jgi:uncharacterized protein
MRSNMVPGAIVPDYELSDHTAKRRKLSELQGQHPMVLVLSRGGYCPKDRRHAEGLLEFHRELEVVAYEWHDDSGNWSRSYGKGNWEFDNDGLMRIRFASINDLPIRDSERKYHWPLGRRPDGYPGLSDLGFLGNPKHR